MSIYDPKEIEYNNSIDPNRDSNPEAIKWANDAGWNWNPYTRSYFRNVAGLVDYATPESLRNRYQSQQYLQQAAALPSGTPNYLDQIKQYFSNQSSNLASAQRYLQELGASAEAGRGGYTNPYEDRLVKLINNPDSISDTNAYRFRFNQGQQALERSAASKGMLNSGNTLAALADYGQGAASQEYGNEFNRLSAAAGQRSQYNLGRMGVSNQELGLRQQWANDMIGQYNLNAGTALKALTSADEMYNERKKLSLGAAQSGGMLRPGPANSVSTW